MATKTWRKAVILSVFPELVLFAAASSLGSMTRRLRFLDFIFFVVVAPIVLVAASGRLLRLIHDYYLIHDTMSAQEKPLPHLPPSTDARARKVSTNLTLTIHARAHLHRFIARALDEDLLRLRPRQRHRGPSPLLSLPLPLSVPSNPSHPH